MAVFEDINENINKYKLPLGLSVVGMVLIIGGLASTNLFSNLGSNSANPKSYSKKSITTTFSGPIKIDIGGAVNNPGVYSLEQGARIEDAIKKASGFAANASVNYISKQLNLSQKVSDGMKIYIPFEGDQYSSSQVAGINTSGKIGINSATQAQLEALPGIGAVTAGKIILARPYADLEELKIKKVVSKAVFEKIKDLVELN